MPVSSDPMSNPEAVPLGMLHRYLAAHGWRRAPQFNRQNIPEPRSEIERAIMQGRIGGRRSFDLFILSEDGSDDVELVLPREPGSADYLRQVSRAIQTLSDLEEREAAEIVTAIRLIGFDVMRSRVPNALVHNDTIHLDVATSYVTGIKNLLAATATTEMEPEPFFLRVKKEATDYADNCRFGHTFKGSFGFTIESPVDPNEKPIFNMIEERPPFSRRVMERMAHGIHSICQAVRADDTTPLISNVKSGFGANACEQFVKMVEETSPGSLHFDFSFSPEWRAPAQLASTLAFEVGPRHLELATAAAKALRSQMPPRPEKIFGRVVRMSSDSDPSDLLNPRGEREISVRWPTGGEPRVIDVRVSLAPPEYLAAVEAHKTGLPVTVSGTLERRGRLWVLSSPSEFHVLVSESDKSQAEDY